MSYTWRVFGGLVVDMTRFLARGLRVPGKHRPPVTAAAGQRSTRWPIVLASVALWLTGCGAGGMTLEQFNESYEQALTQSRESAVELNRSFH